MRVKEKKLHELAMAVLGNYRDGGYRELKIEPNVQKRARSALTSSGASQFDRTYQSDDTDSMYRVSNDRPWAASRYLT